MLSRKNLILIAIGTFVVPVLLEITTDAYAVLWWVTLSVLAGILSVVVLVKKGYLGTVGLILFLLFGWWTLALGSLTLIFVSFLPERARCDYCKELVNKGATKCPKCQGDLSNPQAT